MKRLIRILLFAIIYVFLVSHIHANAEELFSRGKTNYRIVLSSNASETEETAANELATYLKQISGATFEITSTPGERNIYVGYNSANKVFKRLTAYKNDDDGFMVMTIGSDIVIFGGKKEVRCMVYIDSWKRFLELNGTLLHLRKFPNSLLIVLKR